jgi:hypothetical protein
VDPAKRQGREIEATNDGNRFKRVVITSITELAKRSEPPTPGLPVIRETTSELATGKDLIEAVVTRYRLRCAIGVITGDITPAPGRAFSVQCAGVHQTGYDGHIRSITHDLYG